MLRVAITYLSIASFSIVYMWKNKYESIGGGEVPGQTTSRQHFRLIKYTRIRQILSTYLLGCCRLSGSIEPDPEKNHSWQHQLN